MVRIRRRLKFNRRIKSGHIVCFCIAALCVFFTVVYFPTAISRLVCAVKDFGLSVAYFFTVPYGIEGITPTVTELPSLGEEIGPILVPEEWDSTKIKFTAFWKMFITGDLFQGFWEKAVKFLPLLLPLITILAVFVLGFIITYKISICGHNNDYAKESRPLKCWKRISGHTLLPLKITLIDTRDFLSENTFWLKIFVGIWLLNFNIFAVVVDFFAWYFYFAVSFDIKNLWFQIYKLCRDLWPMIRFLPPVTWAILVLWQLNKKRFNLAKRRVRVMELDNCDFIMSQPISEIIVGSQGSGKTTEATDTVLSWQNIFRDKAFEILLDNDLKFPNFPWINFENDLRLAIENHFIYNLYTVREWVSEAAERFEEFPSVFTCFGYDYERYPLLYNDGLNIRNLFEVLDSYARAFFIYIVQSSLIFSNYPVRTDNIFMDEGNLPLWNTDFLERNPKYREVYSRYSHILNFDYIRLGLTVLDDPKVNNSFEFGIIDITEIGKERGNTLENERYKNDKKTANPLTDMMNAYIKLCRHLATIDGFPFIVFVCDEQRPETWGADARDLASVIRIEKSEKSKLAIPFFHLEETFCDWVYNKFFTSYGDYRFRRGDYCLSMYFLHWFASKVRLFREYMYGRYGFKRQHVTVEKGTLDGKREERIYYLVHKKIYADRFPTDCYSGFFAFRTSVAEIGIEEMPEYTGLLVQMDEWAEQKSYLIRDMTKNLVGFPKDQKPDRKNGGGNGKKGRGFFVSC